MLTPPSDRSVIPELLPTDPHQVISLHSAFSKLGAPVAALWAGLAFGLRNLPFAI